MIIVLLLLILCFIIYAPLGSKKRIKEVNKFEGFYYHRGNHNNFDAPENSLIALQRCIDEGYGIELDVQLTKDKCVVIFHDDSLERVASSNLIVTKSNYTDLIKYPLLNTDQMIPLLEDVLKYNNGKVPIYVEIKDFTTHFHELVDETIKLLDQYPGKYFIASFNPLVLLYLKKIRPDFIRCIIAQNYKTEARTPFWQKFLLQNLLLNFLIKPDIISYEYDKANWACNINKRFGVKLAGWAIKNESELAKYFNYYSLHIIESFTPIKEKSDN